MILMENKNESVHGNKIDAEAVLLSKEQMVYIFFKLYFC